MKRQINNGAGYTDVGAHALVQDNASQDNMAETLYMILEGVRTEYEANDEFGGWRLGPDDPGMGDTFWIAREDAQSGGAAVAPESDDGEPPLSDYGRPLRLALNWTGHSFTGWPNAPRIWLDRQGLENVALANDLLMTSPQRYDRLPPRERIVAIMDAVLKARLLRTNDREAALDRLAGTIHYGDFGRGALEHRRRQLDWLLDGMAPDSSSIFWQYGGALVPQDDPLHPRNAWEWGSNSMGRTRLTTRHPKTEHAGLLIRSGPVVVTAAASINRDMPGAKALAPGAQCRKIPRPLVLEASTGSAQEIGTQQDV